MEFSRPLQEWVAVPFSRGSSQLRDRTQVSHTAGEFFTTELPGKPEASAEQVKKEDQKQPLSERFLVLEFQVSSTFQFPNEPCLLALRQ